MPAPRLADFVKAYDVRGVVPEQLNVDVAWALGAAFAAEIVIPDGGKGVVIGHDMRPSSPELSKAFAGGVASHGVDATLIGLCSTDGLYYASGALDLPGAMFTFNYAAGRDEQGRFRGSLVSTGLRPKFAEELHDQG
ncbi:MAG TPA: phosphomannomutase/phosphoglucomutase, partial [Pedococcus sp.]